MNKKIIFILILLIFLAAVSASVFYITKITDEDKNKDEVVADFDLPYIGSCGLEESVNPDQLSRIYLIEESMCSLLGGEMFENYDQAKEKYGTPIDLKQEPTEVETTTKKYSAFPDQTLDFGDKKLTILNVDANGTKFDINGDVQDIKTGESHQFDNLDLGVDFSCGETYQTDFTVAESACCPKPGSVLGDSEEESEFLRKIREETDEDLSEAKREGYKGVILPKSVARDYPSLDFVLLPFSASPQELCCDCMQIYKNLNWWGDYLTNQIRTELLNKIMELNSQKSEFEDDKFTMVERSESAIRVALNEINLIKQNEEYFAEDKKIPKGEWINPDYVVEGEINFDCFGGSRYLKVSFTTKFINAKTEKVFETSIYEPNNFFDLMTQPGRLMYEREMYAKKVAKIFEDRFNKK